MKDLLYSQFQESVNDYLIRHRSILDVMSKLQEAQGRIARAVSKSVTLCGCIRIAGAKQDAPSDIALSQLTDYMETHVDGALCEQCREVIESEIGNLFFYLAALCSILDSNLYDVLVKEHKKLTALGIFNLS